jgi:hypothetical protein
MPDVPEYPDDFTNYPKSFSELRSIKAAENTATIWTPRDCLVDMLRRIDGGMKCDALVVSYRIPTETRGIARMAYLQAVPDNETAVGLLFRAAQMISRDGD